jgi:tetratricopeptide (TPR) repeat protein
MQKAAKLDPRSEIIGIGLGVVYESKGLYTLAENQYRKVIELHPDFAGGYFNLAILYLRNMGQFDKALALLNKSIELDPGGVDDYMLQGVIYMNLGDLEASQEVRDKLADSGAEEWLLGLFDVHKSFYKGNLTDTRETINWLLPKLPRWFHQRLGSIALAQGDIQLSRELYLSGEPGWLEPDQWPELVGRTRRPACIVAWVLMNTGDEKLGSALLRQAISYIDDSLPLAVEHSDWDFPEVCYLTAGDTEKALLSIETQLAHNHLLDWYRIHPMPMYDQIRHEPRYQAAWAERERRISVQRENIEKMAAD